MAKPKIYFRADGNSEIGLGHIIRLISIAQSANIYFKCYFIIKSPSSLLVNLVSSTCKDIIILPEFDFLLEENVIVDLIDAKNGILILDGYHFDEEYKSRIAKSGIRIVSIVDTLYEDLVSDVIINHAGIKDRKLFKLKPRAKIYLGPKYCMLRKEFIEGARKKKLLEENENVFLCFGGADPSDYTINFLKENSNFFKSKNLNIVIGSGYKFEKELRAFLNKAKFKHSLYQNLTGEEILGIMSNCWIGITSASTIAYEFLCSSGVLYLVKTADNQKNIYDYLLNEKMAFNCNLLGKLSKNKVSLALKKQGQLFDGKSIERIIEILKELK